MAPETPRIAELRRRVESDPSSIAFAQLAEEYRRAGDFEAAEQCCRTGLLRHPAYLSARVTLGRTLIELNKLDEADEELQQVLKAAPDNLAAIRGAAEIHQRLGRLDVALDYYRRALTLARHDPELEEIVATLKRELDPPAAPAPPTASPTDFDKLLDSLGIAEHSAPPVVEALLKEASPGGDPESTVASSQSSILSPDPLATAPEASADLPELDASQLIDDTFPMAEGREVSPVPEPDWMSGPLPNLGPSAETMDVVGNAESTAPTGTTESTVATETTASAESTAVTETPADTKTTEEADSTEDKERTEENAPTEYTEFTGGTVAAPYADAAYADAEYANRESAAGSTYLPKAEQLAGTRYDLSLSDFASADAPPAPVPSPEESLPFEVVTEFATPMPVMERPSSAIAQSEPEIGGETEPATVPSPDPPAADSPQPAATSGESSAAGSDLAERDRKILDELEAWLAAIKP